MKLNQLRQLIKEELPEAFDQPYKTKTEKSDYGDVDMLARLPDGTNLSIMFNNYVAVSSQHCKICYHRKCSRS